MSRYYVVTVFPEMVERFCREGLIGRARRASKIAIETITPRRFTSDRHRSIDDTPYGGGSGMVMRPGPLMQAIEHADGLESARSKSRPMRIMLTPQGERLTQAIVRELAQRDALTLICGRYEGVDERVRRRVDLEISLGDFVLMGGELGALVLIEATSRLKPGVLGNAQSVEEESHSGGLLEYPHYTRPAEFRNESVPEILLSGNHAKIAEWRRKQSFARTLRRRPDLIQGRDLSTEELAWAEELS